MKGVWKSVGARRARWAALAAGVVVFAVQADGGFDRLERASEAARFRLRGERKSAAKIVVIGIGERTLADWPEPTVFWPRRLAQVSQSAFDGGARWVGLDWIPERNPDQALQDLGWADRPAIGEPLERLVLAYGPRLAIGRLASIPNSASSRTIGRPWPKLDALTLESGSAAFLEFPDPAEGIVWEGYSSWVGPEGTIPSLAGHGANVGQGHRTPPSGKPGSVSLSTLRLNFRGRPFSFVEASQLAEESPAGQAARDSLKDAYVLIGPAHASFNDEVHTPFGRSFAVGLQAESLATMLDRRPIVQTAPIAVWGFGASALLAAFVLLQWGGLRALVAALGLGIAYATLAQVVFASQDRMLPMAFPLIGLAVPLTTGWTVLASRDRAERLKLERRFGAALSEEVRDRLLAGPEVLAPELIECTVVFMDMRGSSELAKSLTPTRVLERANLMLDLAVPAILRHGGLISRYTGDGFLALFGAPAALDDHGKRAVRACVEGLSAIDNHNGNHPDRRIDVGYGINSGVVVAGALGIAHRHEYTVIGETVHFAARLESLNPSLGTRLLVGAATNEEIRGEWTTIRHPGIEVKGFGSVDVFEVRPDGRVGLEEKDA